MTEQLGIAPIAPKPWVYELELKMCFLIQWGAGFLKIFLCFRWNLLSWVCLLYILPFIAIFWGISEFLLACTSPRHGKQLSLLSVRNHRAAEQKRTPVITKLTAWEHRGRQKPSRGVQSQCGSSRWAMTSIQLNSGKEKPSCLTASTLKWVVGVRGWMPRPDCLIPLPCVETHCFKKPWGRFFEEFSSLLSILFQMLSFTTQPQIKHE